MSLVDSHGRKIDYVRLAVTDRCNLRCAYCMPSQGIDFVPRKDLLSYEEMLRMLKIFQTLGVKKLRITGGEPLVRKGLIDFLAKVNDQVFDGFHLTTNATLTEPHIPELLKAGLKSVNISIDTLNRQQFKEITRRDELEPVLRSIDQFYDNDIPIKLNMVVMKGINEDAILPMAHMAQHRAIGVRYLEEMPFNGTDEIKPGYFTYRDIEDILATQFPDLKKMAYERTSTSQNYKVKDWKGDLGIIASYSRTFCGTCNRLRITPTGQLNTCLYGGSVLDIRKLLRNGSSDKEIGQHIQTAVANKPKDGFEAERLRIDRITESMAAIGG
ncbi:MAG: GTP 3',8-cyclase MoaA [Bacteroidia bacterium]|nr:GTP 3',8-cyclase MoaA [Bacteroidia bacterium]